MAEEELKLELEEPQMELEDSDSAPVKPPQIAFFEESPDKNWYISSIVQIYFCWVWFFVLAGTSRTILLEATVNNQSSFTVRIVAALIHGIKKIGWPIKFFNGLPINEKFNKDASSCHKGERHKKS